MNTWRTNDFTFKHLLLHTLNIDSILFSSLTYLKTARMKKKPANFSISVLLVIVFFSTESCYHFRVLTTESDPATEYQSKVIYSYFWGLVNNPKDFVVPNCNNKNALDEVRVTTNLGYSILNVVSLGIFCPMEVKWRCHKPPRREGDMN